MVIVTNSLAAGRAAEAGPISFVAYPDDTWHRGGGLAVSRHTMAPMLAWQHLQKAGRHAPLCLYHSCPHTLPCRSDVALAAVLSGISSAARSCCIQR